MAWQTNWWKHLQALTEGDLSRAEGYLLAAMGEENLRGYRAHTYALGMYCPDGLAGFLGLATKAADGLDLDKAMWYLHRASDTLRDKLAPSDLAQGWIALAMRVLHLLEFRDRPPRDSMVVGLKRRESYQSMARCFSQAERLLHEQEELDKRGAGRGMPEVVGPQQKLS